MVFNRGAYMAVPCGSAPDDAAGPGDRKKIAWKNQAVIEVDNEIRVVPRLSQTDAAVERRIMEVIRTHGRFKGVKVAITMEKGDVFIRFNLDHPSDILFLKHRVAEIEGVIFIDIQAKFFV